MNAGSGTIRRLPGERAAGLSVALATMAVQSGCAIVSSGAAGPGGEGVAYMLPKALLPVELVDLGGAFDLRLLAPLVVGDPQHILTMRRSGNVFTSDTVTVTVDPAKGLLKSVNAKSDDKSLLSAIKLASGLRAEAADAGGTVVHRGLLDPGWDPSAIQTFNQRLQKAADDHVRRRERDADCSAAASAATDACRTILKLKRALGDGALEVKVTTPHAAAVAPVDCSPGLCYRMNLPHEVQLSGGGVSNTAVLGLPNRSPTFVLPVERWAFVLTSHDIKLEDGVLGSVTTDRPSSAYALAAAPLEFAKAALEAVSQVVQLRIDLSGKEKALAEARGKEFDAKAALEKKLIDGGKAEAALFGDSATTRPAGAWLSVRIGEGTAARADEGLKVPPGGGANPKPAVSGGGGGQTSAGSAGAGGTKGN